MTRAAPALAALILAIYWPALHGPFVWDEASLAGSPLLSMAGGLLRIWIPGQTMQYYPATFTSFWLERVLWGPDPFLSFHLVNAALHCLNAVLAGLCLRRLGFRGAWLAAALFAAHPLQVESVAWISERKNLLSGFFYLASLLCWFEFEKKETNGRYAASLSFFLLALLSKTTACTLPAALLLLRWARGLRLRRRDLARLVPFFAAAAVLGALTAVIERVRAGAVGPEFELTAAQKILVASRALWFYLAKLGWPARLSFSYEPWAVDAGNPRQWLSVLALAAAAAAIWPLRRRFGRALPAGAAFFALTLFPALGFFAVYTFRFTYVADHYQYLACLGPLALAAEFFWRAPRRRAAGWAVVLALAVAARGRAALFADPEKLWADAAAKGPRSALAHAYYGGRLSERGLDDEALAQFREAIRLKPNFEDAYADVAGVLEKRGDLDGAAESYRETLVVQPNHVNAHRRLGFLLAGRRRFAEAVPHYLAVLKLRPEDAVTYNNLGVALGSIGRKDEAAACFKEALRLRPGYAAAAENLALTGG